MTYIELLNRFWKMHALEPFSNSEIALYTFLLAECNSFQWPESFSLTTQEIVSRLGLSRNSINSARQSLVGRGLITATNKKGSVRCSYSICDIDEPKKKGKMDSINIMDIRDELAQKLCNSWHTNNVDGVGSLASQLAHLLCNFNHKVAQRLAQRLAQILCNYTLFNEDTNVSSKRQKTEDYTPLTPQGGREKFDEFIAWYFSEERRGSIDPLCKNFGVTYSEFRRLAEEAIDEMCATGEPFTDNHEIARKMQNFVRVKARLPKDVSSDNGQPLCNSLGMPLGPGEWFDANGNRRFDDSSIVVPSAALPRRSSRHVWDPEVRKWVLR